MVTQAGSLLQPVCVWSHAVVHAPFAPAVRSHVSVVQWLPSSHAWAVPGMQPNSGEQMGVPSQKFQKEGFMQSATVAQL